ncbi:hypothetical protein VC83_07396 [Pseudogymnoascus destructans]|uniref:Uncharacterized protein n=2 Tax=Pseudogymnoascus destructans TaxID=655981 RepID=L8G9L7_PSED2|nr:uncharacterized protein VC83_07396 [Pseudogymnoascus destructans]ELR08726.1 hypothetical protein GMDG_03408 [Pseudogymnoascus destructans 20631-21]OAF56151.2 hypothetical protein VC83_07396 [Pseudogymnoascus destructans]
MAVSTPVAVPAPRQRAPGEKQMPLREETLRKITEPTFTADREERTSFASVKEDRSAVAQSFLDSRISSYAAFPDDAIDESDSDHATSPISPTDVSRSSSLTTTDDDNENASTAVAQVIISPAAPAAHNVHADSQVPSQLMASALGAPLTNPASTLHSFVCPCDGFRGWKEIPVRGKMASRSFSDLRQYSNKGFTWEPTPFLAPIQPPKPVKPSTFPAGEAPLERLPTELLGAIIDQMVADIPPNGLQPRNIDLMALLLTSRALHSATLATLYKQVTIPHSTVFRKLLHHIKEYPALGTIVRRLDFSHFNPTGSGVTARQRAETQNLTQQTMLECLELLPNLREFLAQEHIDEELSVDVLRKLFNNPQLRALDFCAASSAIFRTSMMTFVRSLDLPELMPITRLSFHECTILPSVVLETLLPRLPNLTHLDVARTRMSDKALAAIPETARLTHLNLSRCQSLSGDAVVEFLTTHPSVKELLYLNLYMDAKSAELLAETHVTSLLSILPSTLKSLNLKGSAMNATHLSLLEPLTKHVEELGLGRNLNYTSLVPLLKPPPATKPDELARWVPHALRYIDISDFGPERIDFSALFGKATTALDELSMPLEVIEVCQRVYDRFLDRERTFKAAGWVVKEAGRRGWLVRDLSKVDGGDDGARGWKMGATYWGMRKVPVARAEVGGMYGLYMFKR